MFADAHISSLGYLWLHRKLWSQAINLHFKKRWTCCGESTKVSVASPQTDTSPYPPPSPWFKESSRPLNNLALFCADVTRFSFQENCLKFWAGFPSSRSSLPFLFWYKFPATHGNKRKQNSTSLTNVPNLFFSVVNMPLVRFVFTCKQEPIMKHFLNTRLLEGATFKFKILW